jgi:hypothetical protein
MNSEQDQAGAGAPDALEVTLLLNGSPRRLRLEPRVTLLDALREYSLLRHLRAAGDTPAGPGVGSPPWTRRRSPATCAP